MGFVNHARDTPTYPDLQPNQISKGIEVTERTREFAFTSCEGKLHLSRPTTQLNNNNNNNKTQRTKDKHLLYQQNCNLC